MKDVENLNCLQLPFTVGKKSISFSVFKMCLVLIGKGTSYLSVDWSLLFEPQDSLSLLHAVLMEPRAVPVRVEVL